MKNKNFGKKLIEIRKAKGLTQSEVAEMSQVTLRTIQRIESGLVTPRASTIKIISKHLGFDFFDLSDAGYDKEETQSSISKSSTILWYLKDLFNFKTNTMKKISILSVSAFLVFYFTFCIIGLQAQSNKVNQSLVIELNQDQSVKKVEAVFTNNLNLDSLVKMRSELAAKDIIVHYKKIEFDDDNLLVNLICEVTGEGFGGSFSALNLDTYNKDNRIGFKLDYTSGAEMAIKTGVLKE